MALAARTATARSEGPRTWSTTDWISDLVPHVAYAVVVKTVMDAFDRL